MVKVLTLAVFTQALACKFPEHPSVNCKRDLGFFDVGSGLNPIQFSPNQPHSTEALQLPRPARWSTGVLQFGGKCGAPEPRAPGKSSSQATSDYGSAVVSERKDHRQVRPLQTNVTFTITTTHNTTLFTPPIHFLSVLQYSPSLILTPTTLNLSRGIFDPPANQPKW